VNPRVRTRLLFASAGGLMVVIADFLYWDEHRAAPPSVPPPSGRPPGAVHMLHAPVIETRPGIRQPKTFAASKVWLAAPDR
jgi:hypothetical protein